MKLTAKELKFCIYLSDVVHNNNPKGLENVQIFDFDNIDGMLGEKDGTFYVVFRGSDDISDWINDLKFWKRPYKKIIPYGNVSSKIKVHYGFITSYKKVRNFIHKKVKGYNRVICTGHSLGGVLSVFAALDIQYNFNPEIACVSFAGPRPGNIAFAKSYNNRVPDTYRFVYGQDIVPKLPPFFFFYKHIGQFFQLGKKKWYKFLGSFSNHYIVCYKEAMEKFKL